MAIHWIETFKLNFEIAQEDLTNMQQFMLRSSLKKDCGLTTRLMECVGACYSNRISAWGLPCWNAVVLFASQMAETLLLVAPLSNDSLVWVRVRREKGHVMRSLGVNFPYTDHRWERVFCLIAQPFDIKVELMAYSWINCMNSCVFGSLSWAMYLLFMSCMQQEFSFDF